MIGKKEIGLIDQYLESSDLAKHNANLVYSLPAMANILSGEVMKEYMLRRILNEEERLMHEEGWWYQHQLSLLGPSRRVLNPEPPATLLITFIFQS